MRCIQFHSSFPSLHSQPKNTHQLIKKHKFLSPSTQENVSTSLGLRISIRTSVITNPLILAETSRPPGGDISVLLPTGGLLLFIYAIANFAFPVFLSKLYGFDKETEGSVAENDDSSDDEASKPEPIAKKEPISQAKKRGFQGTRR